MIEYGKPASNQMELELPGFSTEGQELMEEARLWAARHYSEWQWFKAEARRDSVNGYASADYLLQAMRRKFKVSVKNAFAPCFARIAMEEDANIKFRTAESKVDGFTKVKL